MENETEERLMGLCAIVIEGFWTRLRVAARLLLKRDIVVAVDVEEFLADMVDNLPEGNTTCILTATPEELMAPQDLPQAHRPRD